MPKDMIVDDENNTTRGKEISAKFDAVVHGIITSHGDAAAEIVVKAANNVLDAVKQAQAAQAEYKNFEQWIAVIPDGKNDPIVTKARENLENVLSDSFAKLADPSGTGETVTHWPPIMREALAPIIGAGMDMLERIHPR